MRAVGFYTTTEGQHAIIGPVVISVHAGGTHMLTQLPLQLAIVCSMQRALKTIIIIIITITISDDDDDDNNDHNNNT